MQGLGSSYGIGSRMDLGRIEQHAAAGFQIIRDWMKDGFNLKHTYLE